MVDNHKDIMTKTRAMLHFEIVADGERDVIIRHSHHDSRLYNITIPILIFVCKFRHAQYRSSLKTI